MITISHTNYRGMNKGKEHFELLELPSKGEEAMKDAVNFYIEQQYYCYCQYLRECMDDVEKEWDEIGLKYGYIDMYPFASEILNYS